MSIHNYKLRFADETQAIATVSAATAGQLPWHYDVKVIGIHKEYIYNENDPEAEPEVIEHAGWHVDIVSSVPLEIPEQFIKNPKPEEVFHMFA